MKQKEEELRRRDDEERKRREEEVRVAEERRAAQKAAAEAKALAKAQEEATVSFTAVTACVDFTDVSLYTIWHRPVSSVPGCSMFQRLYNFQLPPTF